MRIDQLIDEPYWEELSARISSSPNLGSIIKFALEREPFNAYGVLYAMTKPLPHERVPFCHADTVKALKRSEENLAQFKKELVGSIFVRYSPYATESGIANKFDSFRDHLFRINDLEVLFLLYQEMSQGIDEQIRFQMTLDKYRKDIVEKHQRLNVLLLKRSR